MKLRVLDLFSGIGGFSLGLERSGGFETVAFCEIEPYCRAVLKKHWPDVPCYDDVRTLTADRLAADGIAVDVICGGFPCQDISVAGRGAGLSGDRSGLWSEYARLIGELRPRYVFVENVAALLSRGFGTVLGELAALGYDAEWHCIPAAAVGAPHRRDRVWLIAYANSVQLRDLPRRIGGPRGAGAAITSDDGEQGTMANAISPRLERRPFISGYIADELAAIERSREVLGNPDCLRELQQEGLVSDEWRRPSDPGWWLSEPDVGRVAHGVPARVDRLRGLGNAVVPQIPELIGKAIMQAEGVMQ